MGLLGVLLDVKVLERAAADCFVRLGRVVRRCVDPREVGAKDCGRRGNGQSHGGPTGLPRPQRRTIRIDDVDL